jgi:hypothetical protein
MDQQHGFKLYNDEESFFSWHDSVEDAAARAKHEKEIYGRVFRIAPLTAEEAQAYRNLPVYE